jgi:hypothetical protein
VVVAGLMVCGLVAGCGSSSSSGGSGESEPTYAEAEALAKQMLPPNKCRFEVEDETDEETEKKTLNCFTTVRGQDKVYDIFSYTREIKAPEIEFGGFTTAAAYFQNGAITVDPVGQSEPGQPVLDAKAYSDALVKACGCGETKIPE